MSVFHRVCVRLAMSCGVLLAVAGLGGCSDGSLSSMLAGPTSGPKVTLASQLSPGTSKEPALVVTLSPLLGPPADFRDKMVRELNAAAAERNIALLVDPNAKGDYLLRGTLVASNSGTVALLSYNWDVIDGAGKRVSRTANEESNEAPLPMQPAWASLSPATIKSVATKAIASIPVPAKAGL